mmetsp:Transcript_36100/g.112811  ORF Transcript_36100/g.112811 Transcript_36100/m.112811 type:complete len:183 (+) Transcript_36100:34-582(+)
MKKPPLTVNTKDQSPSTPMRQKPIRPASAGLQRSPVPDASSRMANMTADFSHLEEQLHASQTTNSRLKEELQEMQLSVDTLEKERDFYFHKLREIEVLCLQCEEGAESKDTIVSKTLAILYAKENETPPTDFLDEPADVNAEGLSEDARHAQQDEGDEGAGEQEQVREEEEYRQEEEHEKME